MNRAVQRQPAGVDGLERRLQPPQRAARRYTSVRGFPALNADLALAKTNKLGESVKFSLRAQFLNVLNRHTLGGISTALGNAPASGRSHQRHGQQAIAGRRPA